MVKKYSEWSDKVKHISLKKSFWIFQPLADIQQTCMYIKPNQLLFIATWVFHFTMEDFSHNRKVKF